MASIDSLPYCCGITELGYIRDDDGPEDTLMSFEYHDLSAHAVFSVTSRETRGHVKGRRLAEFIKANKLGEVVETRPAKNPNHRGTLKAWLWTPNKVALKRWQAKTRKANPEKYRKYENPWYYQPW